MENWNSANTVLHYGKDGALTGFDKEYAETKWGQKLTPEHRAPRGRVAYGSWR